MTTVVHCKEEPYDVYIGRPMQGFPISTWGNPYTIYKDAEREEILERYELFLVDFLRNFPGGVEKLLKLDGKVLGCWCKPKPCHGDIISKYINILKTFPDSFNKESL